MSPASGCLMSQLKIGLAVAIGLDCAFIILFYLGSEKLKSTLAGGLNASPSIEWHFYASTFRPPAGSVRAVSLAVARRRTRGFRRSRSFDRLYGRHCRLRFDERCRFCDFTA